LEQVKGQAGDELDNTVKANIELTVNHLRSTPLLAHAIEQGKLKIIGAYYDLHSGLVNVTIA
jgi:carbonic anhydrase